MFNPAMFESMKGMMNGAAMKQSAEMMSRMSDEELKQYMSMTGMNIDPSYLRSASSNMAKMDEATLENMKNNASTRMPYTAPPTPVSPVSQNPLTTSPELSKALQLKNQGNDFFKQGQTVEASEKYRAGIIEIEKIPLSQGSSELEVNLRINLSACLIKEKNYNEVITQCQKALTLGENPKAYYRYGQALFYLKENDKAKEYLLKAKKLYPDDPNSNI